MTRGIVIEGRSLIRSTTKERIPAIFLDRDGVINVDTGYLHKHADLCIYPEAASYIGEKRRGGYDIVVVTNQSGIGRGYYSSSDFEEMTHVIQQRLLEVCKDAWISMTCACPYHKDSVLDCYRHPNHPWRKPNPGMIFHARDIMNIDLSRSLMIGDSECDRDAATAAGIIFNTPYWNPKEFLS